MGKRLIIVCATAGALTLSVPVANAAMAVFDSAAVAQAIAQLQALKQQLSTQMDELATLKDQLSFLNSITGYTHGLSNAVGNTANITLPIPNIMQLSAQLKSDLRCLMPDGTPWGIKTTDLNLGSICESSSKYRGALFVNDKDFTNQGFNKSEIAWRQAEAHRTALLEDATVRALSQSDGQLEQAGKIDKAADQLQDNLASATTVQDRLHISAQAQILQARALASQNQILAQQLRLQAIAEIRKGLPPSKVAEVSGEEEE